METVLLVFKKKKERNLDQERERERTGNGVGREVGRTWNELKKREEYDQNVLHKKRILIQTDKQQ